MEGVRGIREQIYRQPNLPGRAEYEHLVHQFNKDEEQENIKYLLFGAVSLSRLKDGGGK